MGKHFTLEEKAIMEKMNQEGYSHREVGEHLGYSRMQIKWYFERLRKKIRSGDDLKEPKRKGRQRKTPLTPEHEYKLRIKELEREVDFFRSFLHAAGRR